MRTAEEVLASCGVSASDVVDREHLAQSTAVVFLSGSLVEGLGNSASDVDVFVIGPHKLYAPYQEAHGNYSIGVHYLGERRIDIEVWNEGHVRKLAERTIALAGREVEMSSVDREFVHKLSVGLPLVNAELFHALRASFDFAAFRDYVQWRVQHELDSMVEDVVGMMEDGELSLALLRARDSTDRVIDLLSVSRGATNQAPKYRLKRLQQLWDEDEAWREEIDEYKALQVALITAAFRSPPNAEDLVPRAMRFVEKVVSAIQG